ncbi:hypothetical protein MKW94_029173, partial [Papaver nudicaule]|nr:hypothetical protein [Papaver nudicaule]
ALLTIYVIIENLVNSGLYEFCRSSVSVVRPIKKQKLGVPFVEKSSDNVIK